VVRRSRETSTALEVLARSGDDRARALSGRLWLVNKRDADAAANCFRAIKSEAIALHPQVVIERDKALAALGSEPSMSVALAQRRLGSR